MGGSILEQFRQFYADLVTASVGAEDPDLRDAFASVPREDFLPPGPWQIYTGNGYIETPSDDPAFIYSDILVAIRAQQGLNNGQPSLHARCLAALSPRAGEAAVHVGIGTGYYTAILSELVGPAGTVDAIEVDEELAADCRRRVAGRTNITVHARSGLEPPLGPADVIYVNTGVTAPPDTWLDALKPGGRLLFPLAPGWDAGGMLLVTRRETGYDARFIWQVWFYPCIGGQDDREVERLKTAFDAGGWKDVRQFHRGTPPDDTCWYAGTGWWLSTGALT